MSSNIAFCTAFKRALYNGLIHATTDTFKIAFYESVASLGADTPAYTSVDEVNTGGGYTTGGYTLTGNTLWEDNGVIGLTFDDFVSSAGITVTDIAAALIYDVTASNVAVCVFTFPTPYQFYNNTITIEFPTANAQTGMLALY